MAKIAMLRQSLSRALMVSTLLVPAAAVAQTASGSAVETVVVTELIPAIAQEGEVVIREPIEQVSALNSLIGIK